MLQSDNFKHTGCYDLQCSGFVQVNQFHYIGSRMSKTSIYGNTSIESTISITMVMLIPIQLHNQLYTTFTIKC